MKAMDLKERLRASVVVSPVTGCWLWQKSVSAWGYPQIGDGDCSHGQ